MHQILMFPVIIIFPSTNFKLDIISAYILRVHGLSEGVPLKQCFISTTKAALCGVEVSLANTRYCSWGQVVYALLGDGNMFNLFIRSR